VPRPEGALGERDPREGVPSPGSLDRWVGRRAMLLDGWMCRGRGRLREGRGL
jgi:hypothetical protein